MGKGKSFLIGLGIGVGGAILWLLVSLIGGIGEGLGGKTPAFVYVILYLSFFVMVGGPIAFWIVLPIRGYRKRRRSRSVGGGVL